MTAEKEIAAFLRERDEALGPYDEDDAERLESAGQIIAILSRLSPAPAEGMGEAGQEDWPVRECGPETEAIIERDGFFLNLAWTKKGRDLTCRVYEPQLMRLSPALADVLALTYEDALAAAPASPSTGGREEDKTREQVISAMADRLTAHECWAPKLDGGFAWTRAAAICTALYEMASPSPLSGEVVGALREAEKTLRKATTWFHDYAEGHAAKGAKDKAERNAGRGLECLMAADRATAALSSLQGSGE